MHCHSIASLQFQLSVSSTLQRLNLLGDAPKAHPSDIWYLDIAKIWQEQVETFHLATGVTNWIKSYHVEAIRVLMKNGSRSCFHCGHCPLSYGKGLWVRQVSLGPLPGCRHHLALPLSARPDQSVLLGAAENVRSTEEGPVRMQFTIPLGALLLTCCCFHGPWKETAQGEPQPQPRSRPWGTSLPTNSINQTAKSSLLHNAFLDLPVITWQVQRPLKLVSPLNKDLPCGWSLAGVQQNITALNDHSFYGKGSSLCFWCHSLHHAWPCQIQYRTTKRGLLLPPVDKQQSSIWEARVWYISLTGDVGVSHTGLLTFIKSWLKAKQSGVFWDCCTKCNRKATLFYELLLSLKLGCLFLEVE